MQKSGKVHNMSRVNYLDISNINELCKKIEQDINIKGWNEKAFAAAINSENQFVLCVGNNGFLVVSYVLGEADIIMIWVAPDYRKQNIASDLLNFSIDEFIKLKVKTLFLEVAQNNIMAINLYKKFGFKINGKRKNYYKLPDGNYVDAITMSLQIVLE
jgi:[ribosomal protein S18]-alanine N-acetyltransferase